MDSAEIRRLIEVEDAHWWFREKRARLALAVAGVPAGRAVEVGAAGGGNALELVRCGWQVTVVEPDAGGVRAAAERGLPAVRGIAEGLPFGSGALDAVVALDVIEHLDDDALALREFHRVLRPGGRLIVNVPSGPDLWSAHDVALGHVRRYERAGLLATVRSAGFVVDSCEAWNVLLRPVVKWRRRDAAGSEMQEHHPVVNAGLGAVVRLERALPLGAARGVSLFLTAHRPDRGAR